MLEAVVAVAIHAVLTSVVTGALLAALVWLATRRLALTAAWRHALWTTTLVAMALMPLAALGVSVAKGTAAAPTASPGTADRTAARSTITATTALADRIREPRPISETRSSRNVAVAAMPIMPALRVPSLTPHLGTRIAAALVVAWAAGAVAGCIALLVSLLRVRGLKGRSLPLDEALSLELPWLTEVGPGREIYLRLSAETETPVAVGFRRPTILIPLDMADADGLHAIEALVLHEHAHLRRYDDWTNLIQRLIERICWFNPLVWIVGRRIALEREIASDDAVVERTGEAEAYASSLWRLAREMRMPQHAAVAPGALFTRKQISIRIEQLLDGNRARLHRSPGAAAGIACAALAGVALVASAAPAMETPARPSDASTRLPAVVFHVESHALPQPSVRPHHTPAHAATEHPRRIVIIVSPSPAVLAVEAKRAVTGPHAMAVVRGGVAKAAHAAMAATDLATTIAQAVDDGIAAVPPAPPAPAVSAETVQPKAPRSLDGLRLSRSVLESCVGCSLRGADLHGLDLSGIKLVGADLSGANLRNVNLRNAVLTGVNLHHVDLSGADLHGAVFSGVDVSHDDVSGVVMRDFFAHCVGCNAAYTDLHGQDLHGLTLTGTNLRGADLRGADLRGVQFMGVDLRGARLDDANLSGASLTGCNLNGASYRNIKTEGLHLMGTDLSG